MENAGESKVAVGTFAAYGATLWALIFGLLHVFWAAGWYVGLDAEQARAAFERSWFYRYNLAAAGMCAVAVPLALSLRRAEKRGLPAQLSAVFGWSAAAILGLRGMAGVIKFAYLGVTGNDVANPIFLWDFWFCLGGILFGLAAWNFQRTLKKRANCAVLIGVFY